MFSPYKSNQFIRWAEDNMQPLPWVPGAIAQQRELCKFIEFVQHHSNRCGLCGKPLGRRHDSCYHTDCPWGIARTPSKEELYYECGVGFYEGEMEEGYGRA